MDHWRQGFIVVTKIYWDNLKRDRKKMFASRRCGLGYCFYAPGPCCSSESWMNWDFIDN